MDHAMYKEAEDRLETARARILLSHAFFGSLLCMGPIRLIESIPTAMASARRLYFNPKFVMSLDMAELIGLMVHEIMHVALGHAVRVGSRDHLIWNIACDAIINAICKANGLKLPKGGVSILDAEKVSEEEMYSTLISGGWNSKNSFTPDISYDDLDDDDDFPMSEAEKADIINEMRGRVSVAMAHARTAGQMPAGLDRIVENLMQPLVPWQEQLRHYAEQVVRSGETWAIRSRRVRSVYMPGHRSNAMGEVGVITDTSGSLSSDELDQLCSEIVGIVEAVNPERVRIMWADAAVAGEQEFQRGEPLDLRPKGGGGTDMRIPLQAMAAYDPVVVILLTDGGTPWPDVPPPYPLIVVCTTSLPVPIGDVVRFKHQ